MVQELRTAEELECIAAILRGAENELERLAAFVNGPWEALKELSS